MSWNELAAASGSLTGIGLGSIGLAMAGVTGFGIMLFLVALTGSLVSRLALHFSGYSDEYDVPGDTQTRPEPATQPGDA